MTKGNTIDTEDTETIHAGFIPWVDCAILVIASELKFDQEFGIKLKLYKEVSWANIRDRVNLGHYDCAHMLAGMPIAGTLGIGHIRESIIAPFALGRGGNAITISEDLFNKMQTLNRTESLAGGMAPAHILGEVIKNRHRKKPHLL